MTAPLADPVAETRRILQAADGADVPLRAIGGVAVALRAPSIRPLAPDRAYHDIDLVTRPNMPAVTRLMTELGYEPARRFNTLNGAERLLFHDPAGRRVDMFVDTLRMCHDLPLGDRLEVDAWTIPLADLVLSKLQIVELTDRDSQDLAAMLADHPVGGDDRAGISLARVTAVCGDDWGWWQTVDDNLVGLAARWQQAAAGDGRASAAILARAVERAGELRAALEATPKSIRWRLRAAVGRRLAWYSLPEEVR